MRADGIEVEARSLERHPVYGITAQPKMRNAVAGTTAGTKQLRLPIGSSDFTAAGSADGALFVQASTNGAYHIYSANAQTGKVIATEAAGTDKGGHMGGADQQALAAKATVTKDQAEKTALTASPGNTVDHSRLGGDPNGTVFWDVDFTNGGGMTVDAQTGKVIATEAAGTDHGGRPGGRGGPPPTNQP